MVKPVKELLRQYTKALDRIQFMVWNYRQKLNYVRLRTELVLIKNSEKSN